MKDYVAIYNAVDLGIKSTELAPNKIYLELLKKRFKQFTKVEFRLNRNYTDAGIFFSINAWFDVDDAQSVAQVRAVENNLPSNMADDAVIDLDIIKNYMFEGDNENQ